MVNVFLNAPLNKLSYIIKKLWHKLPLWILDFFRISKYFCLPNIVDPTRPHKKWRKRKNKKKLRPSKETLRITSIVKMIELLDNITRLGYNSFFRNQRLIYVQMGMRSHPYMALLFGSYLFSPIYGSSFYLWMVCTYSHPYTARLEH